LSQRPHLPEGEWPRFCDRLTRLAERMAARQKSTAAAKAPPEAPEPAPAKAAPAKPAKAAKPAEAVAAPEPAPQVDPDVTFIGVGAPRAAQAPQPQPEEEEVVGTLTAEPFPEDDGEFAIGGDLIEEDDAENSLEVEPEDEDFALGITDMGPVLETDEADAPAPEPAAAAADTDDADFAIGIQDDAEAALTPEPAAELTPELTPEPEPVPEPDVDDVIDVAFSKTFDQELTEAGEPIADAEAESDAVAEAEFAPDSEPELATPIDDEKPEVEASPLAEAVSEALTAPAAASALRAIDITPVELGSDGLVAFEVAQAQRTRIDYRAIEAVSVAEVGGLADAPVMLVYLVLRARAGRPRSALRLRCDAFDAGSLYPDRTNDGQAVHALLADLLERTRALPLPDPDSALGLRPQQFDRVADFEAEILARLPG
jgi:hypothetical protein